MWGHPQIPVYSRTSSISQLNLPTFTLKTSLPFIWAIIISRLYWSSILASSFHLSCLISSSIKAGNQPGTVQIKILFGDLLASLLVTPNRFPSQSERSWRTWGWKGSTFSVPKLLNPLWCHCEPFISAHSLLASEIPRCSCFWNIPHVLSHGNSLSLSIFGFQCL